MSRAIETTPCSTPGPIANQVSLLHTSDRTPRPASPDQASARPQHQAAPAPGMQPVGGSRKQSSRNEWRRIAGRGARVESTEPAPSSSPRQDLTSALSSPETPNNPPAQVPVYARLRRPRRLLLRRRLLTRRLLLGSSRRRFRCSSSLRFLGGLQFSGLLLSRKANSFLVHFSV